jgi:tetratricopeptide (TPR) repeat protein
MLDEISGSTRNAADEARVLLAQELPAEAVRILRAHLAGRRGAATEYALLGVALARCGDLTAAAQALERAVARDRRNAAYYLSLGQVYLLQQRAREAMAAVERALRLRPGNSAGTEAAEESRRASIPVSIA